MKQDLPSEIIIEILARLPAKTILSFKCICKSWYNLFETHKFVKYHISKSVPGLALHVKSDVIDNLIKFTNELDIQHGNLPDFHFTTITKLYSTYHSTILGSVDGLLLLSLHKSYRPSPDLNLCNPITREYINLPHFHSQPFDTSKKIGYVIYGFGVSKITGQYKVVGIFHDQTYRTSPILPESECKVYTIGSGSWRNVAPHAIVRYNLSYDGAFVNGNIHWLAHDLNGTLHISCFDLETELFTIFSAPLHNGNPITKGYLLTVEGSLCVYDKTLFADDTFVIWLMKEYGDEKIWTKEFVINSPDLGSKQVYPIRLSKDGAILIACGHNFLLYYSNKNKTIQRVFNSGGCLYLTSHAHAPSFLSLKYFKMENSFSF